MKPNRSAVSGVLFAIAATSGTIAAPAQPLKSVKWQNRPLLIFAPSPNHPLLSQQRAIIQKARSSFLERDMIVVEIIGSAVKTTIGRFRLANTASASASSFRRYYGIGTNSFRVILVGKDGGRKLASRDPVSSNQLFGLIDSMPMRRDEMRRQ